MNKLTIAKKAAIAFVTLGFTVGAYAANETESIRYQKVLANLISAQGIQVMQEIMTTVEQSIRENLDEFNFFTTLAIGDNTKNIANNSFNNLTNKVKVEQE